MTKGEVNDGRKDEERRRNAISNRTASILTPYSDACSINIQLHQDRAIHSTPLFAFPPRGHALTHIPTDPRVCMRVSEGLTKEKGGGRK